VDTNLSNPESYVAMLQELALRLTTSPFDQRTQQPQLFVGQLPGNLPFELPIPAGSRIVGSLARGPEHIDMVLDVPLAPEQALAFYKEQMQAAGWGEPEQPMGPMMRAGGFVHTHLSAFSNNALFCKGSRGPALRFMAWAGQAGVTDVRLSLNLDEQNSPCGESARTRRQQHMHAMGLESLIPPLTPPAGTQQRGGGGGGGGDSWYSTATLEADGDLATLAAHYADQLEKAGWTRTDGGQSGPGAWHTWTFQDEDQEPWQGMFFMLKTPGREREYFLYIKIDLANKRNPGGGWFTSSPLYRP
jgi:hypothetical protein